MAKQYNRAIYGQCVRCKGIWLLADISAKGVCVACIGRTILAAGRTGGRGKAAKFAAELTPRKK